MFCLVVRKKSFILLWQPPTGNIICIMFSCDTYFIFLLGNVVVVVLLFPANKTAMKRYKIIQNILLEATREAIWLIGLVALIKLLQQLLLPPPPPPPPPLWIIMACAHKGCDFGIWQIPSTGNQGAGTASSGGKGGYDAASHSQRRHSTIIAWDHRDCLWQQFPRDSSYPLIYQEATHQSTSWQGVGDNSMRPWWRHMAS